MLNINVNKRKIELSNNSKISFVLRNPLFNDSGGYSFPVSIPSSPRNKAIFEFRNNLNKNRTGFDIYKSYDALVLYNNLNLFSGTVNIKESAADGFDLNFFTNEGNFKATIKDKYLRSIDFGEMIFNSVNEALAYINWTTTRYYPETPVSFPTIFNDRYFDPPATILGLKNYNYVWPNGLIRRYADPLESTGDTILVPFLFLVYVLNKLARGLGYSLEDRFFEKDPELSKLVIYNSFNVNFNGDALEFAKKHSGLTHWRFVDFLPKILISEFLKGLEQEFNIRFFIKNDLMIIDSADNILKHGTVVDYSTCILEGYRIEASDKIYGLNVKSKPDPDDSYFKESVTDFEPDYIETIKPPSETFNDLPNVYDCELGERRYVFAEKTWYVINFIQATMEWKWEIDHIINRLFSQFLYGTGKDVIIETIFSTLIQDIREPFSDPWCGNQEKNLSKITPRLLFVRSLNNINGTHQMHAMNHTENYALYYYSPIGIFQKFYSDFYDWIINRRQQVKFYRQMLATEIITLDFTKKYFINGQHYLIKEANVTLSVDKIYPVELTMYQI